MSHYHLEIVMPPVDDIDYAVKLVLGDFYVNRDEEKIDGTEFWDCYEIGGRWSGDKLVASLDESKVKHFHQWLESEKITVSSLACGKQTLFPVDQRVKVDAKWREMFPECGDACILFDHSPERLASDISRLSCSLDTKCHRVIIAEHRYEHDKSTHTGPICAVFMLVRDVWNGVNYMPVKWNGTIREAIEAYEEFRKVRTYLQAPQDDWLCVTVDYHS